MLIPYPEPITKIAKVLLEEIEKYYPGITKKALGDYPLDSMLGLKQSALERAQMCIYIELVKAGAFNVS